MWTSTLYLEPKRILLSKCIGFFYPDIYYTSSAPLQIENIPRQALPSANWVRVRNRLAGICGSDLHLVRADGDLRVAPAAMPGHRRMYPGHEVVGEVIEIGEAVEHLQVGDRVVLQRGANCVSTGAQSLCRACAKGNYNLCEQENLSDPLPIGGGWSEEMLLHEQQLFLLDNGLNDEQGMLIEPTAVALHAVLRRLPRPGEQVLIIGAGTIGLLSLQVVRALAPLAEVTVLARHPFQVELARRMGAAQVIYPRDGYRSAQRITGGRLVRGLLGNQVLQGGFSVVYDTVGRSGTLHDALRWTRGGGTVVLIGVDLHLMHIDLTPVWYREINLLGSMSHGMETWPIGSEQRRETFSIVADLMQQGVLHPEQLITHRFALSNYREALQTAGGKSRSRAIKVAFDYSLQPATAVPNLRASARRRYPLPSHTMTPVPNGGEREPVLPTTRSSPEVDEGELRYNELDEVNQETATGLPPIKRGYGDEVEEIIRPQSRAMERLRKAIEAEEALASSDESMMDEGTQPTLKVVIPRQFLLRSAPPPTSDSPAIEQRGEPEPIILASEDKPLPVASPVSPVPESPAIKQRGEPEPIILASEDKPLPVTSAPAAFTEGQKSDIAEVPTLEMRASELAERERDEAVVPAVPQVDQGEAQDIAESETVLDLVVPKVEERQDIAISRVEAEPDIAESETLLDPVVPKIEERQDIAESETVLMSALSESEAASALVVPGVEVAPDPGSETAPVLVIPGVEVVPDGETESVHVVQPEELENAEAESSMPFEAAVVVEQGELPAAELSEQATEVVGAEPGTSEADAVSSVGEDTPVESLVAVLETDVEGAVGQEIIKEEAREAVGGEMVTGEVEDATGKEMVTDEEPVEGTIAEVSAGTQTASGDGSGKTPGKRVASRRPRKKVVVVEGAGESVAGEQEKVAKMGDGDTNSSADTLSEVEGTPIATAIPKPRSRRKKTKPSA